MYWDTGWDIGEVGLFFNTDPRGVVWNDFPFSVDVIGDLGHYLAIAFRVYRK